MNYKAVSMERKVDHRAWDLPTTVLVAELSLRL